MPKKLEVADTPIADLSYTVAEIAQAAGITVSRVNSLRRAGHVTDHFKKGREILYGEKALTEVEKAKDVKVGPAKPVKRRAKSVAVGVASVEQAAAEAIIARFVTAIEARAKIEALEAVIQFAQAQKSKLA